MSIKSKIFALAAPVLMLALSACATGLPTRVQRFQAMPAPQGQSFFVEPADADKRGGLEFDQYANQVRQNMAAQGYSEARSRGDATLIVTLDYGVDQGRDRVVATRDPFYDPWWGFSGRYRGFGYRPFYSRFGYYGHRGFALLLGLARSLLGRRLRHRHLYGLHLVPRSRHQAARRTASRCSKAPPRRARAPTSCRCWCRT